MGPDVTLGPVPDERLVSAPPGGDLLLPPRLVLLRRGTLAAGQEARHDGIVVLDEAHEETGWARILPGLLAHHVVHVLDLPEHVLARGHGAEQPACHPLRDPPPLELPQKVNRPQAPGLRMALRGRRHRLSFALTQPAVPVA